MGFGYWVLGMGDWGLGIGPNPQPPIPNPQSPIPNPHFSFLIFFNQNNENNFLKNIYYLFKPIKKAF